MTIATGTISGTVFTDRNADGTQDGGDPGMAGQTINLESNGIVFATTTTGSNGTYSFAGATPGTVSIQAVGAPGDVFTTSILDSVTVTAGSSTTVNFGEYAPSTITGTVFADTNADGARESSEPGLAGQTVNLVLNGVVVAVTTTSPNGSYSFSRVSPGAYTVQTAASSGDVFTTAASVPITVTSGSSTTTNFGEVASRPVIAAGTTVDLSGYNNTVTGPSSAASAKEAPNGATTGGSTVSGLAAGETLTANAWNNTLIAGASGQTLLAGSGDARVYVANADTNNTVTGGQGDSSVTLGNGTNTVTLGGSYNSVALGNGTNTVSVSQGDSSISTTGGNATITAGGVGDSFTLDTAGAGNNVVSGPQGNSALHAGAGFDEIVFLGYGNTISVGGNSGSSAAGSQLTFINGGQGNEIVSAGNGTNVILTGGDSDTISTGSGLNLIFDSAAVMENVLGTQAENPNDSSTAGSTELGNAHVTLGGGTNYVYLNGWSNTVTSAGGKGDTDAIWGGNSNDTFAIQSAGGSEFIANFSLTNGDKLDLSKILDSAQVNSIQCLNMALPSSAFGLPGAVDDTLLSITAGGTTTSVFLENSPGITLAGLEAHNSLILG